MPNHITNKLTFEGKEERVKELREFIKGEGEVIDFNTLEPMPKELEVECRDRAWNNTHYRENVQKYGYPTWYEWCVAHWGTKWNAYDQFEEDLYNIEFDTAWAGVPDIVLKISERFPDVAIYYTFADEDCGNNTGDGYYENGEMYMDFPEGGSEEGWEIYFKVNPGERENFKLVDGEWRYIDDDE